MVEKGVKGISLINFEEANNCPVVFKPRYFLGVDIRKYILLEGPNTIFNL